MTTAVSFALTATGYDAIAALAGGFIPARIGGAALPPELWTVPAVLTPLSATLIHAGILHLAVNMVMLGYVGRLTEDALGTRNLVLLYLVGAYAAAAAQALPDMQSTVSMVGASGAISALVGASAMLYGKSRARAIGPIPERVVHAAWLAVAWAAINWGMAVAFESGDSHLAWLAHVGGFLAGAALARPMLRRRFGKL